MRTILSILLSAILLCCSKEQTKTTKKVDNDDFYEKSRKLVLSENKIGQEYFFKRKGKIVDEINIKYLGNIVIKKADTLKFIISQNFTGYFEDSKKGSGELYIYNNKNYKIGFYYVGAVWAVPTKIQGTDLVFSYSNDFCNQTTSISFKDNIPKEIFINCSEKGGDLYTFVTEQP